MNEAKTEMSEVKYYSAPFTCLKGKHPVNEHNSNKIKYNVRDITKRLLT